MFILHTPHQASHCEAAVPFHIHTMLPGALLSRYTKSRQTRASSAEKYLLATGGSHGTTYISLQLCLVKGSLKQFSASVEMISYASVNI